MSLKKTPSPFFNAVHDGRARPYTCRMSDIRVESPEELPHDGGVTGGRRRLGGEHFLQPQVWGDEADSRFRSRACNGLWVEGATGKRRTKARYGVRFDPTMTSNIGKLLSETTLNRLHIFTIENTDSAQFFSSLQRDDPLLRVGG